MFDFILFQLQKQEWRHKSGDLRQQGKLFSVFIRLINVIFWKYSIMLLHIIHTKFKPPSWRGYSSVPLMVGSDTDDYLRQCNGRLHITKTRRVGIIVVNKYTINRNPEWVALS